MAAEGNFNVETIARLLMVDERRVQQLAAEGWIPKGAERGRYSLVGSVQGYIKYLKEHTRESNRGTEHARLARAQAVKVEMDNFRRMGELQTTSMVDETMSSLMVILKSGHEGLPGRVANEFAGIVDPGIIRSRLQDELRAVLSLGADYLQKRADALEAMPESFSAATAAPQAQSEPVGGRLPDDAGGLP